MPSKHRLTLKKRRKLSGGFFGERGALSNMGSTVGQGLKEGIIKGFKQAPKEVLSSIRSKGSSYLQPSGSIANYAGNNIQNIIAGHHAELGTAVGKTFRTIKNTHFNNKGNKTPIKTSLILNPYYSKGLLQSKLAKNKSKNIFNSRNTIKNISRKNNNINTNSKSVSNSLELH